MNPPLPQTNLFVSRDVRLLVPRLAVLVGLHEAIVLQQLWYWLERSEHVHDGRRWVYNTYEQWQEQFPWWTARTVQRILLDLEKAGLVLVGRFNQKAIDRTKWYTIDFEALFTREQANAPNATTMTKNVHDGSRSSFAMHDEGSSSPIPETTTQTTTEEPADVRPDQLDPGRDRPVPSSTRSRSDRCS